MSIDWFWVAANFLWIAALAVALSVYSFAYYQKSINEKAWRTLLAAAVTTLLGLILSGSEWRWATVCVLWIAWLLLDHFWFKKQTG